MSLAVIKDNHITIFGTKYFVGNAQTVSVGSYGPKATPVFGQNKLEVKDHVPAPKLKGKIRTVPPIGIDSTQSSKNDFTAAVSGTLKVIGFNGSQSEVYDALVNNHLKLVQLFVEEEEMKKAVNDSPNVLDDLQRYGGDARVAHQLFVVMEATMASSFTSSKNFDVSADAAGILSITASNGAAVSNGTKITLSPGTGLAYLLLKPDWNKNETQLVDVHSDEWSIN
jgi:hypothetical protein